jgi:hypothetical protein
MKILLKSFEFFYENPILHFLMPELGFVITKLHIEDCYIWKEVFKIGENYICKIIKLLLRLKYAKKK